MMADAKDDQFVFPPFSTEPLLDDGNPRRWTYDRRVNVILGTMMMKDIPGEPGRLEPMTMHPVRQADMTSLPTQSSQNKEVTRYLFGEFYMTPDGFIAPMIFVLPHNARRQDNNSVKPVVCVGGLFVAQRGEPSGLLEPGKEYLIVAVVTPPWIAALFDSERFGCCQPT